jgi:oxalate decarboxylase
MNEVSRRKMLTVGAALGTVTATTALAGTFGNPDEPAQGVETTQKHPRGAVDPGPQNQALSGQFPKAFTPPATDVGDLPQFWASFNIAPRRIQEGGWASHPGGFPNCQFNFRRQHAPGCRRSP